MRTHGRVLPPTLLLAILCAPGASAVAHYSSCELGGLVEPQPVDACREFTETTGLVFEVFFSTDDGVGVVVTYGVNDASWTYGAKLCYRDPYGPWLSTGDCETTPQAGDPAGVPSFTRHALARAEATLMALP